MEEELDNDKKEQTNIDKNKESEKEIEEIQPE